MATPTSDRTSAVEDEVDRQKNARLELRSTQSQKAIIEKAASLRGESVTSYVLSTVLGDARRVINEYHVTEVTLSDWNHFNNILSSDASPNDKLTDALKKYKQQVLSSDGL